MSISATREAVSFTVEDTDPMVEAALAMAELNRRWGYQGKIEALEAALLKIVASARMDAKFSLEEINRLQQNRSKIQLMEELAASFRAMEDENDDQKPRFQSAPDDALDMVKDYAVSLGAELTLSA